MLNFFIKILDLLPKLKILGRGSRAYPSQKTQYKILIYLLDV